MRVECECGKTLRVNDELAGRRVKCPACGDPLTVPEAEEERQTTRTSLAARRAAERDEDEAPSRPARRRRADEEDERDEEPRRRRRPDEDEEERATRRERRRADEDDEPVPRRRRSADEEAEDEPRVRRKKRPAKPAKSNKGLYIGIGVAAALVVGVVVGIFALKSPKPGAPGAPGAPGPVSRGEQAEDIRSSSETGRLYLSADGKVLLTWAVVGKSFANPPALKIWDAETGKLKARLDSKPALGSLCISPDGRYVAGLIRTLPQMAQGQILVWDTRDGKILQNHPTTINGVDPVRTETGLVGFTSDSQRVLAFCHSRLYSFSVAERSQKPLSYTLPDKVTANVRWAYSPQTGLMAVAKGPLITRGPEPSELRIFNPEVESNPVASPGPTGRVHALGLSADGKSLFVSACDPSASSGRIEIWNVADKSLRKTLPRNEPIPDKPDARFEGYADNGILCSADGKTIAGSAHAVRRAHSWSEFMDTETGRVTFSSSDQGGFAAISPDGKTAYRTGKNQVQFIDTETGQPRLP